MSLNKKFLQADRVADRMTEAMIKKQLFPAYKESLTVIQSKLADLYRKYSAEGTLSLADVSRYNRLTTLENDIAAEMRRLGNKQVGYTKTTIKGVYAESYQRAAFGLESELQMKLRFGQLPTKQIEAAILNPLDRIGWPNRTREQITIATRQVKEAITQGIIQGKSYPAVSREVKERLDISATKAQRIVRTEAHRAREEGKLASLEHAAKQGLNIKKRWVSAMDSRVRDEHGAADGQIVDMEESFVVGGEELEYPGDPAGSAENVINCRCTMIAEVPGYEPTERRTKEDDVIPYTNYTEYAEAKGW